MKKYTEKTCVQCSHHLISVQTGGHRQIPEKEIIHNGQKIITGGMEPIVFYYCDLPSCPKYKLLQLGE